VTAPQTATCLLALGLACAPGQVERVEYLGPDGLLRRVELRQQASGAEVASQLGRPDAIRRGPGQVVYWLYTFDHIRFDYVLTFRGDRLAHVRYMTRPGADP
jgi:hypothetical protein